MSKVSYVVLGKQEELARAIMCWWQRLAEQHEYLKSYPRSVRATLRRCATPDEALLTEGFRHLWFSLAEEYRGENCMLTYACLAAVLSHIKYDTALSFAASLGQQKDNSKKPYFSELRFAQLQKSKTPVELQRNLMLALKIIDHKTNVLSVADNILHWFKEYEKSNEPQQKPYQPTKMLNYKWAHDYYSAIAIYDR